MRKTTGNSGYLWNMHHSDTQTQNSPHVQFLFLEMLVDPTPPLPHLRPPHLYTDDLNCIMRKCWTCLTS
jgi:hypothetical protein